MREQERSLSIIRDVRLFVESIRDSARGGDGPTAGCLRSHAPMEDDGWWWGGKCQALSGDLCHHQGRQAVLQGRDGGTEWGGGGLGGTETERAAVARSHEREIKESRVSNDKLSRQVYALMKDNKLFIQELEEMNNLVVNLVRNKIRQEQLSQETWNGKKRDASY
jgi:hypothetical protein